MPIRSPPRRIERVSTPNPRSCWIQASATSLRGSRLTNRASSPNWARETATFASPPPNVISNRLVWLSRRWPGVARRSITSPKVMALMASLSRGSEGNSGDRSSRGGGPTRGKDQALFIPGRCRDRQSHRDGRRHEGREGAQEGRLPPGPSLCRAQEPDPGGQGGRGEQIG